MIKNIIRKLINHILDKFSINRGNINRNDVSGALHKSWGHIFNNNLHGFYIELGVYKGGSAIESLKNFKQFKIWFNQQKKSDELWRREVANSSSLNKIINFHFLDTFKGMPANNENNISFAEGNFISNFKDVKKNIEKYSNKDTNCHFYKGLFSDCKNDVKKNIGSEKVAIANIDCDLESSTVDALNIVDAHLQIGSIILFDDYNCYNSNNAFGQRKAFKDFNKKSNFIFEKFFSYGYGGQSFLVVEKK